MFASKPNSLLVLLLVGVASVAVFGEVIDFKNCPADLENCEVNEVRVDPCPEAASHAMCHIKRRKPATISFDFTPKFDDDTLEGALTWVKSENEELPLITFDTQSCKYTKCPVKNGEKQTYTMEVPIEKKFPTSTYTIKWIVKSPATSKRCCFTTDIKVVR